MRAGCRARQWRPRPTCGVLHGKHGDARDPRGRLRHPLRFRPVSARSSSDGRQQEYPDEWLSYGNPWEFQRPEVLITSIFGGHVDASSTTRGRDRATWRPAETVRGDGLRHADRRLARPARQRAPLVVAARPTRSISMSSTAATTSRAMPSRARAEAICKFLYPNDESAAGRELLRQEYFFVSASLAGSRETTLSRRRRLRSLAQRSRYSSTTPIRVSR